MVVTYEEVSTVGVGLMSIVPEQSRAARALLEWSQEDLEAKSNVAKKTIADFERGAQIPYARTLIEIREAF
jgi:transcriptional regulator with XRE-family HTH domain